MKIEARKFIKSELQKRKITYVKLSEMMKKKGYIYSSNTIRTKVHRGSFSFSFLLEVFDSLDIELICLNKKLKTGG